MKSSNIPALWKAPAVFALPPVEMAPCESCGRPAVKCSGHTLCDECSAYASIWKFGGFIVSQERPR